MRILLVGRPDERTRLRARIHSSLQVVGEFPTMAEAHSSGVEADGILVAPPDVGGAASDGPLHPEGLTRREIEVLELLAEGLPNKAIAERLGISDQTVKFHVASIFGKLGATNRTDAVRRAVRKGVVDL